MGDSRIFQLNKDKHRIWHSSRHQKKCALLIGLDAFVVFCDVALHGVSL